MQVFLGGHLQHPSLGSLTMLIGSPYSLLSKAFTYCTEWPSLNWRNPKNLSVTNKRPAALRKCVLFL